MGLKKTVTASLFLVFGVLFFLSPISVQAQGKPNMLWLVIEDTSPQYIGSYGNQQVNTPNIDKLSRMGVRFTNAYSTGTICSPSRSAIITGVKTYKMGTGHHRSNFPLPDSIKGFPFYLRNAGYYTSNNSKTDYNTSSAKRLIEESWDESSNSAGWWDRSSGQPFFSVFNFGDSHQSRTMTNPYELYVKQVLDELPDSLQVSEDEIEMPPYYRDSKEMRKQVARVYNGVSLADYKIGKILDRLEKDGLMDSTIVFFYADHGEGMPSVKTNGNGEGYKVPFVIWFPEMYKHLSPWGTGGIVTDETVSFVDLAPTVLSLAGTALPAYFDGRSFLGEARKTAPQYIFTSNDRGDNSPNLERSVIKSNLVYTRTFTPYSNPMRWIHYAIYGDISQQIMVDFEAGLLSETQKALLEPRDAETLYDLEADPWETNNLINDPSYKIELAKMRIALKNHLLEVNDVMFIPEYSLKRLSNGSTPYKLRESGEYKIDNAWETIALSGFRGNEFKKAQISALANSYPLVRYWAAVGLKSQVSFEKDELERMSAHLNDNYPPSAIYLAAVVYDQMESKEAYEILDRYLTGSDPDLALLALHNIHHMDSKKDFLDIVMHAYGNYQEDNSMELPRQSAEVLLYRIIGKPLQMDKFW